LSVLTDTAEWNALTGPPAVVVPLQRTSENELKARFTAMRDTAIARHNARVRARFAQFQSAGGWREAVLNAVRRAGSEYL
jgi:hypothetical protein